MLDNLGALAKPIDTLICKISDATGVLYEPTRIRRKAKSEADALIIRTKAEVDAGDIQNRALTRLVTEEIQKQENIESITEKSFKDINDDAKPENIEKDWFIHFFDKSKLISDDEMQDLWAKILAGETNAPGQYTKRFLNFIAEIDKDDASIILKILKYCWYFKDSIISPFLNYTKELSVLSFSQQKYLIELGVISSVGIMGYSYKIKIEEEFIFDYYGKKIKIINKNNEKNSLSQGTLQFTKNGRQLLKTIFNIKDLECIDEEYYRNVLNQFKKDKGFEVIEL